MRESGQRWDVVVVGARAGAPLAGLAAKLAGESGRPSGEIQHALLSGEVEVHHGLAREDAEAALGRLGELGAKARLRPSRGRSAGPPSIALGALPQLEPDPERATGTPTRPTRREATPSSTAAPGAGIREADAPDPVPVRRERTVAPRDGVARRPSPAPVRSDSRSTAEVPMQRAIEAEAPPLDPTAPFVPPPSSRSMSTRPTRPDPIVVQTAPPPTRGGPAPDPDLELDLAAVRRPSASELTGSVSAAVADTSTSASWSQTRVYQALAPPRRLLGTDPVSTLSFGLAIGLAVGILVALATTRGVTGERLLPLEEELAQALSRSSDVERGRLRPPAEIEADLDTALAESRRRFFLVWLITAVPVGLVLGRLRLDR